MAKKIKKDEAVKQIRKFFSKIDNKRERDIKKIKKIAMSHNLKLGSKRKKFCKKCYIPYTTNSKVRIKNRIKSITCNNCGYISRWKI